MELAIGQLIKIILGVLVFVAVIAGVYLFFQNNVFEFFKTGTEEIEKIEESVEEENLGEEILSENPENSVCRSCGNLLNRAFFCSRDSCLKVGLENGESCEWKKSKWFLINHACVAKDTIYSQRIYKEDSGGAGG